MDVTAATYSSQTSNATGAAARMAEARKVREYKLYNIKSKMKAHAPHPRSNRTNCAARPKKKFFCSRRFVCPSQHATGDRGRILCHSLGCGAYQSVHKQ